VLAPEPVFKDRYCTPCRVLGLIALTVNDVMRDKIVQRLGQLKRAGPKRRLGLFRLR
jgi:hypothetical protein